MKLSFWKAAAAPQSRILRWVESQEQRHGWTLKNNVMGCKAEIREEKSLQSTVATGHNRPRPRPKILSTTSYTQCQVERRQDGLMSSDTCLSLPVVSVCLSWLLPFPWFPGSLRCVAWNPRILLMVNVIHRIHYSYACASYFSLPFSVSHRDPMYCTLSFNCVQVQTLPTEQAAPALTESFSRGYDPYTHACKARPLTTVGRTSLSVIVIIFVIPADPHLGGSSGRLAEESLLTGVDLND